MRPARLAVGLVLAIAYAICAWGSALDRAAPSAPPLARLVPAPLKVQSIRVDAQAALSRERPDIAASLLRRAIARDPVDTRLWSALGVSLLAAGEMEQAHEAFRNSLALGWRDGPTQAYWLDASLRVGDWENAAVRADAILRDDPESPIGRQVLERFEASPEGRHALVERLAAQPYWLDRRYLRAERDVDDAALRRRVPVLVGLAERGVTLGCERTNAVVRAFVWREMYDGARRISEAHCSQDAVTAGVGDGSFAKVDFSGSGDPLGWRFVPSASVAARQAPGDEGLVMSNEGTAARSILARPVQFPPGAVRLQLVSPDDDRLALSLDCGQPVRPRMGGSALLDVPDCQTQTLRVWIAGKSRDVRLTGIDQAD